MALKTSVSFSMTPEMVETIDDQRGDKSRSQYVRELIREDADDDKEET
jgi:Arc/MetJ-type ribon-helix-helix transcriptional regulator